MNSEAVELRLMRYFFEQCVDESFYNEFSESLVDPLTQHWANDEPENEDELVALGIKLINNYLTNN